MDVGRYTLAAILSILCCMPAAAQTPNTDAPGKLMYLKYCGACHGPGGKGDGIAGASMNPGPADVRHVNWKYDGKFPFQGTMSMLDGTGPISAHGSPDIPVWGESWKAQPGWSPNAVAEAKGKVILITEYLLSIQEPKPPPPSAPPQVH